MIWKIRQVSATAHILCRSSMTVPNALIWNHQKWHTNNPVGYRGGIRSVSWKLQRFQNLTVRKYQDSTPIKHYSKSIGVFQNYVWFSKIYLCFKISHNYSRFTKIPPSYFLLLFKTLGDTNCFWTHQSLNIKTWFSNLEVMEFEKLGYVKRIWV